MSLYDEIGRERIEKAVREFYSRAVVDPLIGHFFFKIKIEDLIDKQIDFSSRLLGYKDSSSAQSRPLKAVHHALKIRPVHFARRQKLMSTVLKDIGLEDDLIEKWMGLENSLKNLILSDESSCID